MGITSNPQPSVPTPRGFYSPAILAGRFLFISGQLPTNEHGEIVGHDLEMQTRQVMKNISANLEAAGAKLSDLVSITVYVSDVRLWKDFDAAYRRCMEGIVRPPARAVVPTTGLHYGALLEIQAIAYLAG